MDISKYYYIVLNLTDIDTQFKVYKKILEINGKISVKKRKQIWRHFPVKSHNKQGI